jgi:hypothetical protein
MIEDPISVAEAARRISTLINSRSSSPRLAELEAIISRVAIGRPLASNPDVAEIDRQIQDVMRASMVAEARLEAIVDDAAYEREEARADELWDELWERLEKLGSQLPMEPRSFADLLAMARIAYYWCDKKPGGELCSLDPEEDCPKEHWAARLIFATMSMEGRIQSGGCVTGKMTNVDF